MNSGNAPSVVVSKYVMYNELRALRMNCAILFYRAAKQSKAAVVILVCVKFC